MRGATLVATKQSRKVIRVDCFVGSRHNCRKLEGRAGLEVIMAV
ncbi:hypothetical protein [Candidatus Tisiphia endosymbiont of Hybos culiciformis]